MAKIKYKEPVYNPRKISIKQTDKLRETLEEFGDLSGIVYNRNTGNFVGGNQRSKVMDFDSCKIEYTEKKRKPDAQGTVALGFVIWKGKKYSWREVKWDEEKERRGNIVANKGGGEWDWVKLEEHFKEEELIEYGFSDDELDFFNKPLTFESEGGEEEDGEDYSYPDEGFTKSHVRMVRLFLDTETEPKFREFDEALRDKFGTDNLTDTVFKAMEFLFKNRNK